MKNFLLYILLFFGIVTVVDFGFGYGCEWLQDHAKGGRMKSVRRTVLEQNADIVVMGSSRAHHHYVCSVITDKTGLTTYNAGLDGNGIVTATGLYEFNKSYGNNVLLAGCPADIKRDHYECWYRRDGVCFSERVERVQQLRIKMGISK